MNLPNRLSLVRICIVPLIACIYLFPYAQFGIEVMELDFDFVSLKITNVIVLVLFAAASITDFLDGYIARKHQLVTSFGKFIDPIADKLLVNTMLLLFAANGTAPIVPVLVMIWRDTVVDGLRMTASSKGIVVAAGFMGKVKTVAQMITIIVLLLNNLPFELLRFPMGELMLWFSMCVSVISGIAYFMQLKDVIMESM
ncbi:CDP-diacylglycerol--glycerol-3-phosphate 3-phosphatidyltransferase [bacterium c-19]|nr:CDP-diacylglycerol--glycerol-3-phosphate 3-phosphatidyltransferase [bacterium c-19]